MNNKLDTKEIYKSSIRAVTLVFGSIFNNINIRTYTKEGDVDKTIKVPLIYSNKSDYYLWAEERLRGPNGTMEIGKFLPVLTFDMQGLGMNVINRMNPNIYHAIGKNTNNENIRVRIPNAYTFNFGLTIWCKNMDDSIQILDQILPLFAPEIFVKIKESYNLNIVNDVEIILDSISKDDNSLAGIEENRVIQWDLGFTVNANIIPREEDAKLIDKVIVEIQKSADEILQEYIAKGKDPNFMDLNSIEEKLYEYPDIPEE